jgi:hypothetical protein
MSSLFWVPGISVVHNSYKEFMDLIDEERVVQVYHLFPGEKISWDAILFCTG